MEGSAVSGALFPLASGVIEAICDWRLEGMCGFVFAEAGLGCGFLAGCGCAATGLEGNAAVGGSVRLGSAVSGVTLIGAVGTAVATTDVLGGSVVVGATVEFPTGGLT